MANNPQHVNFGSINGDISDAALEFFGPRDLSLYDAYEILVESELSLECKIAIQKRLEEMNGPAKVWNIDQRVINALDEYKKYHRMSIANLVDDVLIYSLPNECKVKILNKLNALNHPEGVAQEAEEAPPNNPAVNGGKRSKRKTKKNRKH